ncbi:MAG: ABC transporter permease, partial [Rhodobiaceae bacterium]|nr:ABC transporter permease [Rhodobiaceae bacterium]
MVFGYSFMPARSFSLLQAPTLENYVSVVSESYYISFAWSVSLAALTVLLLFPICYPVAYGMARLFGKWANLVTVLIA